MVCGYEPTLFYRMVAIAGRRELWVVGAMLALLCQLAFGCRRRHGVCLVRTLVVRGGGGSRGRFGCAASSMARSSVAAGGGGGGRRGGEGAARYMTLSL